MKTRASLFQPQCTAPAVLQINRKFTKGYCMLLDFVLSLQNARFVRKGVEAHIWKLSPLVRSQEMTFFKQINLKNSSAFTVPLELLPAFPESTSLDLIYRRHISLFDQAICIFDEISTRSARCNIIPKRWGVCCTQNPEQKTWKLPNITCTQLLMTASSSSERRGKVLKMRHSRFLR